jgi:hypothetical protein
LIPNHILFVDLETLPADATVGMDIDTAPGWIAPELRIVAPIPRKSPAYGGNEAKLIEWANKEAARICEATNALEDKARASIEADRAKTAEKWRRGSLSAFNGRIGCISYAFGEDPIGVIDCAEDERLGLLELDALIQRSPPDFQIVWVAHNGTGFDFPMIQLRALHHKIPELARSLHQDKPWDGRCIDTALWVPKMGGGHKLAGTKLGDLCELFGIDHDVDNPIDGSQVLAAYVEGRWPDVIAHASADVRDLRELYRILWKVRR